MVMVVSCGHGRPAKCGYSVTWCMSACHVVNNASSGRWWFIVTESSSVHFLYVMFDWVGLNWVMFGYVRIGLG